MHCPPPMPRFAYVLAAVTALGVLGTGCGSSVSLEFAKGGTTYADASDDAPYPDGAVVDEEGPGADAALVSDAEPPLVCPPGKDGKSNVCVRVLRGSDGPSISADTKSYLALDGRGALMIGLAAIKPTGTKDSFIAMTWLPTESSSAGKFASAELPKVAELSVPPGTYWAFAVFRDQEPYIRPGVAVGDYVPRLVELSQVTVVADMGASVDVRVHPVRAVDVDVHLGTAASGSGSGPLGAWLVEDKSVVGEGRVACADLSGGRTSVVRLFTTYTGSFDVRSALFDFSMPSEDGSGAVPLFTPGTVHNGDSPDTVKITEGDWLMPTKKRIDLDKVVPIGTVKPADASPSCASYAYAPPK